jgi:hypothetical protein
MPVTQKRPTCAAERGADSARALSLPLQKQGRKAYPTRRVSQNDFATLGFRKIAK